MKNASHTVREILKIVKPVKQCDIITETKYFFTLKILQICLFVFFLRPGMSHLKRFTKLTI